MCSDDVEPHRSSSLEHMPNCQTAHRKCTINWPIIRVQSGEHPIFESSKPPHSVGTTTKPFCFNYNTASAIRDSTLIVSALCWRPFLSLFDRICLRCFGAHPHRRLCIKCRGKYWASSRVVCKQCCSFGANVRDANTRTHGHNGDAFKQPSKIQYSNSYGLELKLIRSNAKVFGKRSFMHSITTLLDVENMKISFHRARAHTNTINVAVNCRPHDGYQWCSCVSMSNELMICRAVATLVTVYYVLG